MGDGLALLRSLSQVNCVLLTPLLLKAESRGSNFPFVRIIEQLRVTGSVHSNKPVPPVFCGDVTHQTDQILAYWCLQVRHRWLEDGVADSEPSSTILASY